MIVPIVIVTLVLAMPSCGLLNATIEFVAYRPLRRAPRLAPLITAIGVSFIIQDIGLAWKGPNYVTAPDVFPHSNVFSIGGVDYAWNHLIVVLITVPVLLALTYLVQRTRQGKAMRATAQDKDAAAIMGINVNRTISFTFLIAGALAGAAGLVYALYVTTIRYDQGFQLGLIAFTAAVLGGIGNLPGAVLGARPDRADPGAGTRACNWHAPGSDWTESIVFSILILILVFRPEGLLGERTPEGRMSETGSRAGRTSATGVRGALERGGRRAQRSAVTVAVQFVVAVLFFVRRPLARLRGPDDLRHLLAVGGCRRIPGGSRARRCSSSSSLAAGRLVARGRSSRSASRLALDPRGVTAPCTIPVVAIAARRRSTRSTQAKLFTIPVFGVWPDVATGVYMLVFMMMAVGLNIVVGYAGLLDLGYVAFYAIGAYTAAWFASLQFSHSRPGTLGAVGIDPQPPGDPHLDLARCCSLAGRDHRRLRDRRSACRRCACAATTSRS